MIDDLLKAEMLEVLRANDQLKKERQLGKVFLVSACCFFWYFGTTTAKHSMLAALRAANKL